VAAGVLERWSELLASFAFVKVMPHDYKRVMRELAEEEARVANAAANGVPSTQPGGLRPLDAVGEAGG
jgi:hypothetical protein